MLGVGREVVREMFGSVVGRVTKKRDRVVLVLSVAAGALALVLLGLALVSYLTRCNGSDFHVLCFAKAAEMGLRRLPDQTRLIFLGNNERHDQWTCLGFF